MNLIIYILKSNIKLFYFFLQITMKKYDAMYEEYKKLGIDVDEIEA